MEKKSIGQDRARLFKFSEGKHFQEQEISNVFHAIYNIKVWNEVGPGESVSGYGSSLEQTNKIIKELPSAFKKFSIKTMLDVPCGDFNWMKHVVDTLDYYLGGDIVPNLVDSNNKSFANRKTQFQLLDITKDSLPKHDLIFCRDCLVHFSIADIRKAIANIKDSGSRYLMATTFPGQIRNDDIVTGGWRPLNFVNPPFHFPAPIYLINEGCTEMDGAFEDKSLGLWLIGQLPVN